MKPSLRTLTLSVLVLALTGCAAQMAYRDGRQLVEHDQVEAALLKFQDAIVRDPTNAQYRASYLHTRDRAAQRLMEQADRFMAEGKYDLAQQNVQRVLSMNSQNERARQTLRALEMAERQDKVLAMAAVHIEQKEFDAARNRINTVLTENPAHAGARKLLRDIADQTPPPPAESGLSKAYKSPITIEFREAPIKQVFELISRRSGLNFIFDKDVKTDTRTSIFLKNSTVESAIYFLLMTNQLEQQVMDGNTILIYPNVAAKLKEYQETVVRSFFLSNADAKLVANTLKTILKSRDVVADEKLNMVIVRDSADAIRMAERIVALQDQAEPEVVLDVEILEVKRSHLTELGVEWPASLSFSPLLAKDKVLTVGDLRRFNRNNIGVGNITAAINANKTDGDTNLLANPSIRVRNKEKAKVVIGDKVPVITTTVAPGTGGFASESVNYVDVGLTLNAEPTIYLNNEVAIRVSLEVSNLVSRIETKTGTTAYQIGTRQASTMLQLKDGENQILAGLINSEERSTGNRIPGLGDIPLLGRLFGSQQDDNLKTEIVLSITPHLVRNLQRPEASAAEFSAGTEANFRRKPDVAPRPAVVMPPRAEAGQPLPAAQINAPLSSVQPGPPTSVTQPQAQPQAVPLPPPTAPVSQPAPQPLPPSIIPPNQNQQ